MLRRGATQTPTATRRTELATARPLGGTPIPTGTPRFATATALPPAATQTCGGTLTGIKRSCELDARLIRHGSTEVPRRKPLYRSIRTKRS